MKTNLHHLMQSYLFSLFSWRLCGSIVFFVWLTTDDYRLETDMAILASDTPIANCRVSSRAIRRIDTKCHVPLPKLPKLLPDAMPVKWILNLKNSTNFPNHIDFSPLALRGWG
jgi:hypothetical protein